MKCCDTRTTLRNSFVSVLFVSLLVIFISFSAVVSYADTIIVTNTNDTGPGSLRWAISSAGNGDVISLDVEGTITLSSELEIIKGMTIQGPGAERLEISGNGTIRVFYIETDQPVKLSGVTIVKGDSGTGWGGGMRIIESDNVEIEDCVFENNVAPSGNGGAVYSFQSGPIFVECKFLKNIAKKDGGAIFSLESSLTLIDCTFDDNAADYYGGAVNNNFQSAIIFTPTRITGCTFSGNRGDVVGHGGAIHNENGGNVEIVNCTFFGNDAYYGGGVSNYDSSPVITNCTFAYNSAISGSGIYNQDSSPVVTNCIFWDKVSDEIYNASGTPELSYCVVRDGEVGVGTVSDNIITADPMLRTLSDNGGPTKTCALGENSSAIDSGTAGGAPSTDQRGVSRPQGSGYEIGAFEYDGSPSPGGGDGGGGGGCSVGVMPIFASLLLMPLVFLSRRRR